MFFRDIPPFLALILSYQQDTFVGNWASSRGARQRFSGHTRVLLLSRRAANRGRAFADSTDGIGGAYAREFAAIGTALRKRYGSRALCHASDGRGRGVATDVRRHPVTDLRLRAPSAWHGARAAQILRATRGEVSLAGKASPVQHSGAANRPRSEARLIPGGIASDRILQRRRWRLTARRGMSA